MAIVNRKKHGLQGEWVTGEYYLLTKTKSQPKSSLEAKLFQLIRILFSFFSIFHFGGNLHYQKKIFFTFSSGAELLGTREIEPFLPQYENFLTVTSTVTTTSKSTDLGTVWPIHLAPMVGLSK